MMIRKLFSSTLIGPAVAVTVLHISRRIERSWLDSVISRGSLLRAAGLAMATLVSVGGKGSALARGKLVPDVRCVLTPEQTEGPYYIAKEKVRRNISENRPGTPLTLKLAVVDATTCAPIKGAAVDIWHCDAGGIYSGFVAASTGGAPGGQSGPTDKNSFLRGIQITNKSGVAVFQTIYPGWYRGRTVHIHAKVHLGDATGRVVHTGQLYFPETLTTKVFKNLAYKARAAARDTFNSNDGIYQQGGAQSTLAIKSDGNGGYVGAITLGVRRT